MLTSLPVQEEALVEEEVGGAGEVAEEGHEDVVEVAAADTERQMKLLEVTHNHVDPRFAAAEEGTKSLALDSKRSPRTSPVMRKGSSRQRAGIRSYRGSGLSRWYMPQAIMRMRAIHTLTWEWLAQIVRTLDWRGSPGYTACRAWQKSSRASA